MIDMVEPTDRIERAIAIHICRANAYLHPDTGKPMTDREKAKDHFAGLQRQLPYKKWIWMWNYGREEWDPGYSGRDSAGQL